MAVQVNVRKRKHSQQDEEDAPKKKKRQKHKDVKKNTTNPESEQNQNDSEEVVEQDEKPIKFSNDFKMLNFRTKLRGTNFIYELRHFLYLAERKTHIVAKYIEKRGKPLELAEALERVDKSNALHIGYICQALHTVLLEIVSNQPAHMESATSACRYFLKVHSNAIEQLLESAKIKHRCIALKLLTAIVCVDPQLGRQILAAFNVLSDVRKIDQYLSHMKLKQIEEETVRKCYIHFVLAFMIDGNTVLVQNIIDRSALVQALIFGLLYDDQETVCLVLKTLRKYVLENSSISKTKKVHVFDLECCKRLLRLYDWYGPKVFAAKFSGKNSGANLSKEKMDTLINQDEKEAVSVVVHEFLIVLLSSRKHGISFDAVSQLRQKHNTIQGKLIGFIQRPWCCERKMELIKNMLKSCPDLARHTVRHFSNVITLKRTGEEEWTAAANFLNDIITLLHPDLLQNALKQITLTDFIYWIKDICLPLATLVSIRSSNLLRHSDPECRLATHGLLLAMFTQYSNFINAAMKREQAKGGSTTLRRFKFELFNHILTHFPSVDQILHSLNLTTCGSTTTDAKLLLRHLNVTLDLILVICKQNRSFVNRTSTVLDYLKLIRPLYTGDNDNDDENENEDEDDNDNDGGEKSDQEDNDEEKESKQISKVIPTSILANHGDIELELKAIKTILLLHPNALEPHQKQFGNLLKSLIKGFVNGKGNVQRESKKLLREIFKNTGIFDSSILEIDLWLEALLFSDSATVDVVTQVFIEVLKVTQAEVDLPADIDIETNKENLNRLFENIEKGHSVQTYVETFSLSKLLPLIFKGVEIVKPLDEFIELICLLLFQYHPTPAYVSNLYEKQFKSPTIYMKNCLDSESNIPERVISSNQIPFLDDLQIALLKGYSNTNFETIFGTQNDDGFKIDMNGKNYNFDEILKNERVVMIYIQQVMFLIKRLAAKKQLALKQAESAADFLIHFLSILHKIEIDFNADENCYTDDDDDDAKRTFLGTILTYIFDIQISSSLSSAQLCNTENEFILHYMKFLSLITKYCCSQLNDYTSYLKNFRLKIVKAVAISLESVDRTKKQSNEEFIELIMAFQLELENCSDLLEMICNNLKYNDFFIPIDNNGFQRTFYYELLITILRRLNELRDGFKCKQIVKCLAKYYVNFINNLSLELNLEDFEEAFYNLLCIVHQYISCLDCKLFSCMFAERKLNKSSIKLACLLLERSDNAFNENFLNLLPSNINKRELIYPMIEIAFKKHLNMDTKLLNTIYQAYRNGFMKTIEKPQKAGAIYKENVNCSIALVTACMPATECIDFCKKRFQFNDPSELYQIQLIYAIYEKAWNSLQNDNETETTERHKIFVNFLNVQIQLLSTDLKRQAMNMKKLEMFSYHAFNWFTKIDSDLKDLNFDVITKSQHWMNFCKSCLKFGMQIIDDNSDNADMEYGLLLKLMAFLCDKLYNDFDCNEFTIENEEEEEEEEPNEPAQLFEMICTHSKYYDIVLSSKGTQMKTAVLRLLVILAKKSPKLSLEHLEIPVILGAYHAKLSDSDRYALALINIYEIHRPVLLQKFRPFIWGESAISFYALNISDLNERTRLQQQETTINFVMSLIDFQTSSYTIDNFPIWRKLNSLQQLPRIEFIQLEKRAHYNFGSNDLERHIELNWNELTSSSSSVVIELPPSIDLRLCPKADNVFIECYDPAFFIPLMSSCFAPESNIHAARPVENGLLALCFAALSSQHKEMRQAAGNVQLRYRAHFEQRKFLERPLWIQAYENIQSGLADLSDSWKQKHKNHTKDYQPISRVPYIPALFIARTFNITNDPTDLLYKHLTMYLRLKNTFNFQCIPEFNIFFHSTEIEHHTFRQFIIDVIRKGVKCSSDLFLLVSTNTFKVLLGFYGSAIATLETNLLILSTLSTCVKIPASAKIMIEHVGILPWMQSVISTLEFYHFDVIEGFISILNNLWYAVTATKKDFYNYNYIALEFYNIIVLIVPLLSTRITIMRFAKLLNVMQKTAAIIKTNINAASPYAAIADDQLNRLIGCAEKHFGGNSVQYLKNLKILGIGGAGSQEAYCDQLRCTQSLDDAAILALSSLRNFIINWWQQQEELLSINNSF